MDISKPENIERHDQSIQQEKEIAETKLRSFERSQSQQNTYETSFTDKAGHDISVRTWENGNSANIRAHDLDVSSPGKEISNPNFDKGVAGHAEVSMETSLNGEKQARLHYIETRPEYRNVGVGGEVLSHVEQFAQKNGATEIHGTIENEDAQNYWRGQAEHGWTIDYSKGVYGDVNKKLG